jgi:hypothetical protein
MLTVNCTLTFPDGKKVTAQIEAQSPATDYPITYAGCVDRLVTKCATGTASDLELLFTLAARRSRAELNVVRTGQYRHRHQNLPQLDLSSITWSSRVVSEK